MRYSPPLDRRRRPIYCPNTRRRRLSGLAAVLALMLPVAAGAAADERFGEGMPLVLKDGRIATVKVHAIPFETGADTLDDVAAETLRTLFEPLATDCFLTAQAIGHVAPGITRDGDTLSAHRLARARADSIQAALTGFGMPQPSVASVWDWQFLLHKSQVTLWVFSLTQGDDCDGTPLPRGEPALAAADGEATAATTASTEPASAPPVGSVAEAAAPTEAAVAAPAAAESLPQPPRELSVADSRGVDPTPALPAMIEAPGPDATDPLATAAVAPPEAAPAEPRREPADATAEVVAEEPITVAAIDRDGARAAGAAGAPALAITFEMNSSYFPGGVGRELRAFLDSLPTGGPIEIELLGAVGTSAVRGASDEEARRYNAWMAERRIERVAEWLQQNAGGRELTFAEKLVENDASRQVRLRANAVSQ